MTAMKCVPWVAALAVAAPAAGCSQIIGIEDLPRVEELAPVARSEAAKAQGRVRFGYSVSLSGTLMAVGAPDDASADTGIGGEPAGGGAEGSGAVYVFRHEDGSWVERRISRRRTPERTRTLARACRSRAISSWSARRTRTARARALAATRPATA